MVLNYIRMLWSMPRRDWRTSLKTVIALISKLTETSYSFTVMIIV